MQAELSGARGGAERLLCVFCWFIHTWRSYAARSHQADARLAHPEQILQLDRTILTRRRARPSSSAGEDSRLKDGDTREGRSIIPHTKVDRSGAPGRTENRTPSTDGEGCATATGSRERGRRTARARCHEVCKVCRAGPRGDHAPAPGVRRGDTTYRIDQSSQIERSSRVACFFELRVQLHCPALSATAPPPSTWEASISH